MPQADLVFDADEAVDRLMRFLAVEGVTGQEEAIGRTVVETLVKGGVPRKSIRFDKANEKIPLATQTGNLIVTLPGTRPGPRRLFMTHLDTVPLCAGAVPVRKGDASCRPARRPSAATIAPAAAPWSQWCWLCWSA